MATQQIAQKNQELAAATTPLDQLKVAGKWVYISAKQDAQTSSGVLKGLAAAGWENYQGLGQFLADPITGLNGLKQILVSPEARQQLGEQVIQSLSDKIARMQSALTVGGDQHAEQLGQDLGSLIWQVGSVATGVGGSAKGGVALAKAGVNIGSQALENSALQLMKLDAGAIKRFRNADEINALMTTENWAPACSSNSGCGPDRCCRE